MKLVNRITDTGLKAVRQIRTTLPHTYQELKSECKAVEHVTQLTYWNVLSLERALEDLGIDGTVWSCFKSDK